MQNKKRRPATGLRGLCLIHDNAPAHKCVLVQDFLKEEKVVPHSHPLYSPDLSPCDFFLIPLYESRSAHGSATRVFRVYLKGILLCLYRMDFRQGRILRRVEVNEM